MTITQAEIDELFAPRVPKAEPPRTARVTCRVCERPTEVAITAPARLCALCAEDLTRTLDRIRQRYNAAFGSAQNAWMQLEADVAHADEVTQARWHAYQDAIMASDPRVRETDAAVRQGRAGPFANLVRRWLAWQDAHAQLVEVERWTRMALEEIEAQEPGAAERYRPAPAWATYGRCGKGGGGIGSDDTETV